MPSKNKTRYFLLGPEDGGTNLMKLVGPGLEPYILNDADEWEYRPRGLKYASEGEASEVSVSDAKRHFARISRGKKWQP